MLFQEEQTISDPGLSSANVCEKSHKDKPLCLNHKLVNGIDLI